MRFRNPLHQEVEDFIPKQLQGLWYGDNDAEAGMGAGAGDNDGSDGEANGSPGGSSAGEGGNGLGGDDGMTGYGGYGGLGIGNPGSYGGSNDNSGMTDQGGYGGLGIGNPGSYGGTTSDSFSSGGYAGLADSGIDSQADMLSAQTSDFGNYGQSATEDALGITASESIDDGGVLGSIAKSLRDKAAFSASAVLGSPLGPLGMIGAGLIGKSAIGSVFDGDFDQPGYAMNSEEEGAQQAQGFDPSMPSGQEIAQKAMSQNGLGGNDGYIPTGFKRIRG